jgi:hypothetical protein
VEVERLQHPLGRAGAGRVETDRDVVAAERVAQREGALVARLTDESHRLEADTLGQVPVVERIGDRAVELLIAPSLGPHQQELGVTPADRSERRCGAGEVAPGHRDDPLGRRVQVVGAAQEGEALPVLRTVVPDDEGDGPPPPAKPLQDRASMRIVRAHDHLVVGSVATTQLAAHHIPRDCVGRRQQHDRVGVLHAGCPSLAHPICCAATLLPHPARGEGVTREDGPVASGVVAQSVLKRQGPKPGQEDSVVRVELLYFEGCPNWMDAEERLVVALRETGHGDTTVERRRVEDSEHAQSLGFIGSPSIRIDGKDPFATGAEPVGLACRLYDTPAGPSGSPTSAQLAEVLR